MLGEERDFSWYDEYMNGSNYLDYAKDYGLYVGLMVVGISLIGVGVVIMNRQPVVEMERVVEASQAASPELKRVIVIDVGGEVVNPGVYTLNEGTRLGEVLRAAGGLTKMADGQYVSKRLNLATRVTDGAKIYIPAQGEEETEEVLVESSSSLVSINNASQSQLEELWGVGEARAKTIIQNRPYVSVEDLVSKAKIPQNVIESNQGKIGL